MKKFFMTLAIAAAMVAAVSCACNNGADKAACDKTECADCADCDGCTKAADDCCSAEGACDKQCCEKKAGCDSTCVDCKKAE